MEFAHVISPKNTDELLQAMKKATTQTRYICGGTDYAQKLRNTEGEGDLLISLQGVAEMRQVNGKQGVITVGAALPFSEIAAVEELKNGAFCLIGAASHMGSPQVRNRATLGGNIANASACADSIAPLLVLGAKVLVLNAKGEEEERELQRVITGVETNSLSHDEVIFKVVVPKPAAGFRSSFGKLGAKTTVTISKINMALGFHFNESSKLMKDVRVALGAVGTIAKRFPRAEEVLEGSVYSEEIAAAFAEQVSRDVEEAIKTRASMPYKRRAVMGVALDVLSECVS
jgi:CO/xanthine dehydrogenase FAD-binding subunit